MTNLREELQRIYHEHHALSPRLVVDAATPEDHPLHKYFEWDDEKASRGYRLVQARSLIRSVRIVFKENEQTGEVSKVRAYVSTGQSGQPSAYLPVEEAAADPFTYQLVLRDFQRQIMALRRQFGHLQEYEQMMRTHGLDGAA